MAEVKFMDDNNSWFGGFNALIAGFQRVIMHVWEFVLKRLLAQDRKSTRLNSSH